MKYRPELDGIRGVAIAGVLLQHSSLAPGGHFGVVLFFVLSGYLITGLLAREYDTAGRVSLRAFYLRRAARLAPALLVALAGLTLALFAVHGAAHVGRYLAAAGLYVSNIGIRLFGLDGFIPVNWSWSLAMEEQFYLLWPPLLVLLLRRGANRRKVGGWLLATGGAIAVLRIVEVHMLPGSTAYYAPELRGDALLVGSAIALTGWRGRWAWQGSVVLAALTFSGYAYGTWTLQWGLPLGTLACAAIVAQAGEQHVAAVLRVRPLVYLGSISYALYLWNSVLGGLWWWPTGRAPHGVGLVLWLAASGGCAHLSTRYLEAPLRRRARRWSDRRSQPDRRPAARDVVADGGLVGA